MGDMLAERAIVGLHEKRGRYPDTGSRYRSDKFMNPRSQHRDVHETREYKFPRAKHRLNSSRIIVVPLFARRAAPVSFALCNS